jgi:hypothetical protein
MATRAVRRPSVSRLSPKRYADPALMLTAAAAAGAVSCVAFTVALASGRLPVSGPIAVGVAGFVVVAGWCFAHRRVDHTLVALALYLGLLDGYLKLSTGSPVVTLARDVLVIAITAGALVRSTHSGQRHSLPPLAGFVIAFTGIVLIELANPSARGGLEISLAGARQHLEFVPLFFLGYAFVRTTSQIRVALLLLVVCASIGGVVSFVQSTLTPDQFAAWGPGYAERILGTGDFAGAARQSVEAGVSSVRAFGLGSDAGSGALLAALAIPGMIALLMVTTGRLRFAVAALSVGVGLAVATSGSRAAVITVFVSIVAFGLLSAASRNALKAVAGLAVALALIFGAYVQLGPDNPSARRAASITPDKALSTFERERAGSVALFGDLAQQFPLGAGLATAGPASEYKRTADTPALDSETQWNFLVLEIGIAGVVVYVAFLARLLWLSTTRIRHVGDATLRLYLAALAAPLFALLIAGFAGPVTAATPCAPFLWLVSGILAFWLVTAHRELRLAPAAFSRRAGSAPGAA